MEFHAPSTVAVVTGAARGIGAERCYQISLDRTRTGGTIIFL